MILVNKIKQNLNANSQESNANTGEFAFIRVRLVNIRVERIIQ